MTAKPVDSFVVSYPLPRTGRRRNHLIENQSDFSKLPPLKADMRAPAKVKQAAAGFLTTFQAAEFLGLKAKTLANWRVSGQGPEFHRMGSAVRYHPNDLNAWAERGKRSNTSQKNRS